MTGWCVTENLYTLQSEVLLITMDNFSVENAFGEEAPRDELPALFCYMFWLFCFDDYYYYCYLFWW